jgi:hypothetical protein
MSHVNSQSASTRRTSPVVGALLMLVGSLAGAGIAALQTPLYAAQGGECNERACDIDYGVCFNTDIRSHCTGESPCSGKICEDTTQT